MKTPIYGFCHRLVSGSSHNLLSVGDASNPGAVHNDMGLSESERCQKSQTVQLWENPAKIMGKGMVSLVSSHVKKTKNGKGYG